MAHALRIATLLLLAVASGCGPKTSECVPTSCDLAGASCGQIDDGCGGTLNCGSCERVLICVPGLSDAGCVCTPEGDAELCASRGAQCGALDVNDRCGRPRHLECGSCAYSEVCGFAQPNKCTCVAESDAAFCSRNGADCGAVTAADNCGVTRTVSSCGVCAVPKMCGGDGKPNQCACRAEPDWILCSRARQNCAALTVTDRCGVTRDIASCGSCVAPLSCGGAGTAGQCGCTGETNTEFCARYGAQCGSLTALDYCGLQRTVASCGGCTAPLSCAGAGAPNQCGCTPESDPAFCSRLGANCGQLSGIDNCGAPRTAPDCGTCYLPSSCGGGGTNNQCGCTSESDSSLCSRLQKNCGTLVAKDNCNRDRTVTSCGTCSAPDSCSGGGVSNVCGCTMCGGTCVDVSTDSNNCGGCGRSCQGGACVSGKCPMITLVPYVEQPGGIAVDRDRAYWTTTYQGTVQSIPLDGGAVSTLATGQAMPMDIKAAYGALFWATTSYTWLTVRLDLDGGAPVALADSAPYNSHGALALSDTEALWPSPNGNAYGAVFAVGLDGGARRTIAARGANQIPVSVAVDQTHVYWIEENSLSVLKAPIGGGTPAVIAPTVSVYNLWLAIDDTHVYWTENLRAQGQGVNLKRVPKAGGQIELLYSDPTWLAHQTPMQFVVDGPYVYFVLPGFEFGKIMRVPKTGGTAIVLADNQDNPWALTVDDSHVYWVTRTFYGAVRKVAK